VTEPRSRILVVDDDAEIRSALELTLSYVGHPVRLAARAKEGIEIAARGGADLVLLDVKMPGMDGMEALARLRETAPEVPVIMISGHGDIALAVSAVKGGAFDFLEKPLDQDRLLVAVRNALAGRELAAENRRLRQTLLDRYRLLGESAALEEVRRIVAKAAPTEARVLVTGENGTGKELVAHQVHLLSRRAAGPFVAVNCAAIPQELIESELFGHEKGAFTGASADRAGHFEAASGGTLFLDEIGDMSAGAQSKVLRALEEGVVTKVGGSVPIRVDVRVVAATNKDLEKDVEAGSFRQDLYYRLRVIPVHIPPLRERPEDVPGLALHFLVESCRRNGIETKTLTPAALDVMRGMPWPGNVRELRNLVEGLVVLTEGKSIDREHVLSLARPREESVPGDIYSIPTLQAFWEAAEKEFIRRKLHENGGNIKRTAERIEIQRSNLYKKLDRYDLR
jgi:two-component system nitrogen regulation response regulator NtrX